MRYVQAEHSNNELTERLQKVETKLRDWMKERDVALGKWKVLKEEKSKLWDLYDSKVIVITVLICANVLHAEYWPEYCDFTLDLDQWQ